MRGETLGFGIAEPLAAAFFAAPDHAVRVEDAAVITGMRRQFCEVVFLYGFW